MTAVFLSFILLVPAEFGTASWYDRASCRREGTSGVMANGRRLNDNAMTCASWRYPFGTRLIVANRDTGAWVLVTVTDRGPAKRLVRRGRVIDLSRAAFKRIAPLSRGVVRVGVFKVQD